jgi:hypothetical protein
MSRWIAECEDCGQDWEITEDDAMVEPIDCPYCEDGEAWPYDADEPTKAANPQDQSGGGA